MATTAQRRLQPKEIRRFGSQRDPHGIPDLTEIQTRSYAAFLQHEVPWQKRAGPGDRGRAAGNLPHRELRQDAAAGISPLRTGQAALRAGRVPATAADLRPPLQGLAAADQGAADRGRSLPGRHAHHARRRRVHHQRRRARGGQPVAPQPGRRLRHGNRRRRRPPLAQLPHHSRTRQLDRAERHPQGKPRRPHRPERQVLDHDAAAGDGPEVRRGRRPAARLLRRPRRSRSSTAAAPRRSKARWPSATSSIRRRARGPAKSSSSAARRSPRTPPR